MILEVLDALSTPAGPDDTRTLAARRAEALKDLFAQALTPTGIATEEKTGDQAESTDDDDRHDDQPPTTPRRSRGSRPRARPPTTRHPRRRRRTTARPCGSAARRC